jgi:hypothetical protein
MKGSGTFILTTWDQAHMGSSLWTSDGYVVVFDAEFCSGWNFVNLHSSAGSRGSDADRLKGPLDGQQQI